MIHDLAAWRAGLTPERRALHCNGRWLDYAALDARAARLAARLHAVGVRAGDRVGILAANHIAHVDLLLAAPKLGAIFTPFNHRLAPAEQAALAALIEPALLLHDTAQADAARAFDCPRVALDDYDRWQGEAGTLPLPPPLSGDDIWMILFTGGSTGTPKGACIPYRQVWANACATALAWGIGESDLAIQATPAFHAALNVLATPLWFAGGAVVWHESFEPGRWLADAAGLGATVAFMVPTMYQMLAEHQDFAGTRLSRLRWAVSGGAPCPAPVREAFAAHGIAFRQGFGMTEAGVNCFAIGLEEARAKPEAVGRPMPGLQAELRGDDGRPCADGEVGELYLRGAQVFAGYFGGDEETAKTLVDGWLATGDLARRDADGAVFICGRRKEMYVSGGENVYPAEVETAIYRLPGIAEACVVGVPHERWGETGLAVVVQQEPPRWTTESLREALRRELAGYKLPGAVRFVAELPKSGAGKILRRQLRDEWLAEREVDA